MANTHSLTSLLTGIYSATNTQQLFPISINWQQGNYLAALIQQHNPRAVLELGSGFGLSSIWIQSALSSRSSHTAVDPWAEHLPKIRAALSKRHYKLITAYTSQEYLARNLSTLKEKIDFIFMDADNRFDGCLTDCYFANQILKTNGILVIRNCWNPSVRRVCQFMLTNLPYHLVGVPSWINWLIKHMPTHGMGWLLYHTTLRYSAEFCVLKKTATDNRKWNHFATFC